MQEQALEQTTVTGAEEVEMRLTVNGQPCQSRIPYFTTLLDFLRDHLYQTGTKEGCGEGECGACTVIVDGETVNSCLVLAPQVNGRDVQTIEGLAENGQLHVVQQKFIATGAVQCGYCIPGFILSTRNLLDRNPRPDREEILEAVEGNICRCTGYSKIWQAIEESIADQPV